MNTTPRKWKYTTARKYMGDDAASWAIFNKATGRTIMTGLYKSEVNYHRGQCEDILAEQKNPKPTHILQTHIDSL